MSKLNQKKTNHIDNNERAQAENQVENHTDHSLKEKGRDLSHAPVWRFVLPFLVVFLALGQGNDSWANDSNLYPKQISEDAAFLRLINFSVQHKGRIGYQMNNTLHEVQDSSASPFHVVKKGKNKITLANKVINLTLKPGERRTYGFTFDNGGVEILGEIKQSSLKNSISKTGLFLYNFNLAEPIFLGLASGDQKIIDPTQTGGHAVRWVNPVKLAMRVYQGRFSILETPLTKLRPGISYSFLVADSSDGPLALFAEDIFIQ